MPAAHNGDFVTWGRYDAEHQEVLRRLVILEEVAERMRIDETDTNTLKLRVGELEAYHTRDRASDKNRKDKLWQLTLAVFGGIAVTVFSTALLAWLHVHGG